VAKVKKAASILDTAALVFVLLLVAAIGWWILRGVFHTIVFVGKLAVLAVAIAVVVRLWVAARGRLQHATRRKAG
jgi:hypothetical protein